MTVRDVTVSAAGVCAECVYGVVVLFLVEIRFQCMGTWEDEEGNVWSGMADLGEDIYRERFRCMVGIDTIFFLE